MRSRIEFDGGCCRDGVIEVKDAECVSCKTKTLCLMVDASEEEYEIGAICKVCIDELFKGTEKL